MHQTSKLAYRGLNKGIYRGYVGVFFFGGYIYMYIYIYTCSEKVLHRTQGKGPRKTAVLLAGSCMGSYVSFAEGSCISKRSFGQLYATLSALERGYMGRIGCVGGQTGLSRL